MIIAFDKPEKYRIGKNTILTNNNYAEVIIISKGQEFRAKVDLEDVDLIRHYTFHYCKGYAVSHLVNGKRATMHRLVLNLIGKELDKDIDHINHDKLDNRKSNLRLVTRSQNISNQRHYKNGHKGVYYHKRDDRWRASIRINGKNHYKTFLTYEDACEYIDNVILK